MTISGEVSQHQQGWLLAQLVEANLISPTCSFGYAGWPFLRQHSDHRIDESRFACTFNNR